MVVEGAEVSLGTRSCIQFSQRKLEQNLWWRVKDSNLHTVVPEDYRLFHVSESVKVALGVEPGSQFVRLTRHNLLAWCRSGAFRALPLS